MNVIVARTGKSRTEAEQIAANYEKTHNFKVSKPLRSSFWGQGAGGGVPLAVPGSSWLVKHREGTLLSFPRLAPCMTSHRCLVSNWSPHPASSVLCADT